MYARKNGKIELVRTETTVIEEEQLFDRQQRLREELRHCRSTITQMQAKEKDLLDELAELQALLADVTATKASAVSI